MDGGIRGEEIGAGGEATENRESTGHSSSSLRYIVVHCNIDCTSLGLSYGQHASQAIPVVEFTPLHNLLSRQPRKLLISVCILRQICLSGHDSRFHEEGLDPEFFPLKGETTRADKLVG